MSESLPCEEDTSDIVTLDFQITFHKTETVLAPDGSLHGINAVCLKQNYHKILKLEPFKDDGSPELLPAKRRDYIRGTSDHRALLSIALALFDAQFARTTSEPLRARLPPPPPDRGC